MVTWVLPSRRQAVCCTTFFVLSLILSLPLFAAGPVPVQNGPSGPRIWLQENQPLPVEHVAGGLSNGQGTMVVDSGVLAGLGKAQPVSMASGDLDADGFEDLVVGYSTGAGGFISVHRGNIDAFAPQSDASFQAIGRGEFPSPFLLEAQTFSSPVSPDFMALGDFTGNGNRDLAVAAKGSKALFILPGDGKGNFGAPQMVNVPGGITALAAGTLGSTGTLIVGGTRSLTVLVSTPQGLAALASYPVAAPVSNILFGDFGDTGQDVAFLSGGKVQIVRSATMQVTTVSLPVTVRAFALGSFISDRNPGVQIAFVAGDGSIQIAARSEFDPRAYSVAELAALRQGAKVRTEPNPLLPVKSFPVNGWQVVESIPGVASLPPGQTPVFFRTRASSNGSDDVMLLNPSSGQLALISHPDVAPGASTFLPGQVSLRPYSGTPIAALPMRINVDGRPGVMAIHAGQIAPSMIMPIPDPTFFPNRFDDITPRGTGVTCLNTTGVDASNDCTLREAIIKANATAGTDTIMLQAGTYTLALARNAGDHHTSAQGTLEVQDSLNIVGAGQATTIIQGGTQANLSDSIDKVISFNQDIDSFTNATVNVSSLTLQNGNNKGDAFANQDGYGGVFDFDTGLSGNNTLTMTNVTINNGKVSDGQGGGFTIFNTKNGTGFATCTNCIVQNNNSFPSASDSLGDGGGIVIDARSHIVLSNTQVINNTAHANAGINATGGGMFFQGQHTQPQSHISNSTISGNTAAGIGGGMNTIATLLIDAGTVINNNTAGTDANHFGGGGIRNDSFDGLTLTKVAITGNSTTGDGGGIFTGDGSGNNPVTISFSRLAGNSSTHTLGSSNIFNFTGVNPGNQVTATNNWWGTNAPATTIVSPTTACPAVVNTNDVCFDPFIVLTHTGSPDKIKINASSTLTGTMANDNHGNAVGLANLTEIIGLPITFDGAVLGTIPQAQPETLNASAQATATFNAGGTSGIGTANATVDQAVVPVNSNLIASATEAATTATITTVGAIGFSTGDFVKISGVGVAGYNSSPASQLFKVLSTPTATSFTYTANTAGLGPSNGGTVNAGIIILEPPSMTKSFGPKTIQTTGGTGPGPKTSTITFSITNANVIPIDVNFTDNLPTVGGAHPGSLVVASTPNVVNNCGVGGTVTATAGSSSISFSNANLAAGTCTVTVDVQSAVDDSYSNSVTINSTAAGNGNTASDTLNVINPPSIAKNFGAATIPLNGTTSLTITVSSTNQNQTLSGITFTDTLPNTTGTLVVATPNNLTDNCSGTATANSGSGSVSLASSSLAPGTSCTVSLSVQGTAAGVANNSVTASDTTAGTGAAGTASVTVIAPPTISKSFSPKGVPLNSNSTLSFTVTNPNTASALSGVAFTDTLPGGVKLASTTVTGACGSGTITATINNPPGSPSTVSLSGGTLTALPAAGSSCTFSVSVTGISAGAQVNTTGAVSSTEGGTGGTASDTLTVIAPPTISKSFSPKSVPLNSNSTLSFTVTNPNTASALSGVAFTDTLPGGVKLASTTVTGACGSGTITATINNPPGSPSTVSLLGGTLTASPAAGSSCTFSVSVTGISTGAQVNTTGAVSSTEGGTGGTASDTLTVIAPPTISKSFSPKTIPLSGSSTLSFTLTNPNTVSALSGVAFTDTLPGGAKLASTTVTGSCGSGTITATINNPPGSPSTVSLSGGTLTASPDPASSCTFSVSVTGIAAGAQVNTTSTVSSTEGGTGGTASDTLTVIAPPTISKHFGHITVPLNQSDTLSFTLTNPNTTSALSGIAFTDTLPGGLKLASTTVTGSCGSGTITATINNPPGSPSTVSLSGGTLTASPAAGSSCTFSVSITGITPGPQVNTTSTVSSTEGGTGGT
ncbi:MAG TPA: hypothetical protein VI636_25350, partial [Candidatus Angelobacter sp.]